jgi:hypothetical protein
MKWAEFEMSMKDLMGIYALLHQTLMAGAFQIKVTTKLLRIVK